MAKTRNAQDATRRNITASQRRDDALNARLVKLEAKVDGIIRQLETTVREAHNANLATMRIGARRG